MVQILAHTEQEIRFLEEHAKNELDIDPPKLFQPPIHALTLNFNSNCVRDHSYGSGRKMSLDDHHKERLSQIIKEAVALDCSEIAKRCFLLYRGANFKDDDIMKRIMRFDRSHSLSFGTGLFSGCMFDPEATPFYYMRESSNAYVIPVPFADLNNSPFHIPTRDTVAQLGGHGETFHSRTKAWKGFDVQEMSGIAHKIDLQRKVKVWVNGELREEFGKEILKLDHLKSNLNKEEFIKKFKCYKRNVIPLYHDERTADDYA